MGRFEAVLFDAGDTLIRLTGSGTELLHEAAATLGSSLDPEAADRVWQRVLDRGSTAEELAKGRDLSTERHREVWTELYTAAGCEQLATGLSDRLYERTVAAESWEAFPDALPTLEAVRSRGVRVAVVSDTGFDLRPALERVGLMAHLDAVLMSYEQGVCKPAASVFRAACDLLGVRPERALMVGDNPLTDSGAVTAGLYAFLLPAPAPPDRAGLSTCCRCSELADWRHAGRGSGLRGRAQRGPGRPTRSRTATAPAPVDGRTVVAVFSSPVARSLMRFARETGFRTVLYEPEPDRVTEADRRLADLVVGDADPAVLHPDADVVVTDHHRAELGPVLRDVLVGTPRWIGVMGNPRHPGPHVAGAGRARRAGRRHRPGAPADRAEHRLPHAAGDRPVRAGRPARRPQRPARRLRLPDARAVALGPRAPRRPGSETKPGRRRRAGRESARALWVPAGREHHEAGGRTDGLAGAGYGREAVLPWWFAVGVVVVLMGLLITKVLENTAFADADAGLDRWLEKQRTPTGETLTHIGTLFGETPTIVGLTAVTVVVFRLAFHRWRESVILAICVTGQAVIFLITTILIDRAAAAGATARRLPADLQLPVRTHRRGHGVLAGHRVDPGLAHAARLAALAAGRGRRGDPDQGGGQPDVPRDALPDRHRHQLPARARAAVHRLSRAAAVRRAPGVGRGPGPGRRRNQVGAGSSTADLAHS